MKRKLLRKGDVILIFAAVSLALVLFLCINVFNKNSGELVQIEVGGEVLTVLPLNENTLYEIKNNDKVTNTVEIKDGFVFVTYADCKDQICKNHKKISRVNESIICLPNKVVITVISAQSGSKADIDGVV